MSDTLNYLVSGYTVIFILIGIYALWLAARTRKVRRQLEELDPRARN